MRRLPVSCVFLSFLMFIASSEAAERQLGQHEDLTAFVPEKLSCRKLVAVTVRAPDETAFQGDRIALQKLLGVVRIALADCPKVEKIVITGTTGTTGKRMVYRGVAEIHDDWVLKDTRVPPSLASTESEASASVRESQQALAQAGYDPGPANGLMAGKTKQAIRRFQKDSGLPVDGEPSPALLTALESEFAPAPASPGGDPGARDLPEHDPTPVSSGTENGFAGAWSGYFQCSWGTTLFDLDIKPSADAGYQALLTYREDPEHSKRGAPEGGQIRFLGQASSDSGGIDFRRQEQTRSEGIFRWGLKNFRVQHDEGSKTLTGAVMDEGGCPFLQAQRPGAVVAQANLLGRWEGRTTCTAQYKAFELDTELVVKQGPALRYEATLMLVPPDALAQGVEKGLYLGEDRSGEHKTAFVSSKTVKKSRASIPSFKGFEIASTASPDAISLQFTGDVCAQTSLKRHNPASSTYQVSKSGGTGLFLEARSSRAQCEAVIKWIARFDREYPEIKRQSIAVDKLWPKLVKLFGDDSFVPVFGQAYDVMSAKERVAIAKKLNAQCRNDPFTKESFNNAFSSIVGNGFSSASDTQFTEFTYDAIAHNVHQSRKLRQEMDSLLSEEILLPHATITDIDAAFQKRKEGITNTYDLLWPSEVKRFEKEFSVKQAAIATALVQRVVEEPLPSTLASVKDIFALKNRYAHMEGVTDAQRSEAEQRLNEKADLILAELTRNDLERFAEIPPDLTAPERIEAWHKGFLENYESYTSRPLVTEVLNIYEAERSTKLKGTFSLMLKDFRNEVAAIPVSFEGAEQLQRLADATDMRVGEIDAAQRDTFREIADARRGAIYSSLGEQAIKTIQATGSDYNDAMVVLAETEKAATPFEERKLADTIKQIYNAGISRAQSLAEASYQKFKNELESLVPDPKVVEDLRERAFDFDNRAEVIPAFAGYQEVVLEKAAALKQQWCDRVFADTGLAKVDAPITVVDGGDGISLRDLVCAAILNGHKVTGNSQGLFSKTLSLDIGGFSEEQVSITFAADNARSAATALIGIRVGEKNVSREEWIAYVGDIAQPQLSGIPDAAGVTDCDRLAADPDDPQTVHAGIGIEKIDIKRARDACMLAIEVDPENPRIQYQLGRVLNLAGDEETAVEFFDLADQAEYGIASYQLGNALFMQEGADEEILGAAYEYYIRAKQGGYEVAREQVDLIEKLRASIKPEFTEKIFRRPSLIKAVYEGDFSSIDKGEARKYYDALLMAYPIVCQEPIPSNVPEAAMDPRIYANGDLNLGFKAKDFKDIGGLFGLVVKAGVTKEEAKEDLINLTVYHECGSSKIKEILGRAGGFIVNSR